jgi:peroxiredoxin
MAQLEPLKDDIAATGASLIYIAAEKRAGVWNPEKYLRENPVSFPFLLDEDRSVTKTYGLYHRLGRDAVNIAHPATLVVDRQKVVRSIYRGEDQHDRAPIAPVLQILRDLQVEASQ